MSNVRGCYFLSEAMEEAKDEDKVVEIAESCGCGGECTLEDGCILYKGPYEKPKEEQAFFRRLRNEIVKHMLGE